MTNATQLKNYDLLSMGRSGIDLYANAGSNCYCYVNSDTYAHFDSDGKRESDHYPHPHRGSSATNYYARRRIRAVFAADRTLTFFPLDTDACLATPQRLTILRKSLGTGVATLDFRPHISQPQLCFSCGRVVWFQQNAALGTNSSAAFIGRHRFPIIRLSAL